MRRTASPPPSRAAPVRSAAPGAERGPAGRPAQPPPAAPRRTRARPRRRRRAAEKEDLQGWLGQAQAQASRRPAAQARAEAGAVAVRIVSGEFRGKALAAP